VNARVRPAWVLVLALGLLVLVCRGVDPNSGEPVDPVTNVQAVDGGALVQTGETWRVDDAGRPVGRAGPVTLAAPRLSDCAGPDCFRIEPDRLAVAQSQDGGASFTTVWEITGRAYDELVDAHGGRRPASVAVAVRRTERGLVVFVANGVDGLLFRDVTDAWHRLGEPRGGEGSYFEPPPRLISDRPPTDPGPPTGATVAVLVLVVGVVALVRRRTLRTGRAAVVFAFAALCGAVAWLATGFPAVGMFPGVFYGVPVILTVLVFGVLEVNVQARRPLGAVDPRTPRGPKTASFPPP
jgi:hypothetical protein